MPETVNRLTKANNLISNTMSLIKGGMSILNVHKQLVREMSMIPDENKKDTYESMNQYGMVIRSIEEGEKEALTLLKKGKMEIARNAKSVIKGCQEIIKVMEELIKEHE